MITQIIVLSLILLFVYRLSNEVDYFCGTGAGCGNPQRFPTYKQQGWSFTDAIPPPDPFHKMRGPGPLDGYVDTDLHRWADLQSKLKRGGASCFDKNYETGW